MNSCHYVRKVYLIGCTLSIAIFMMVANINVSYAEATTHSANLQRVNTTLKSNFICLKIDAEVAIPSEDMPIAIYSTDYAKADDEKWKNMFFGDANAPVKDELVGLDLDAEQIFYPDLEQMFSIGEMFTRYVANEARLFVTYRDVDITPLWGAEKKDQQAVGLEISPETAKEIAQSWIEDLDRTVGWNDLKLQSCYTMPPNGNYSENNSADLASAKGFYIIEYRHVLNGIPIAFDKTPYLDETKADIYGDVVEIFIGDDGIFRVTGYYRECTYTDTSPLTISLDEAIQIVSDNMEYTIFNNEDSMFVITEVEFCYRLVQTLETYDKDAIARVQARPAWRFASKINRNMFDEFVMFVDANTGEVLP